ncbi:TonB-dependent receptor [Sphingomonas sp. CBMAI 2297]|uniref:TonB-dependent receptor n=1 Tax=Sphingomonas sp. CBMAI 2297 TaxID=2991720 RepID=UPI002453D03C|nr:TonB-dependent receptor [Sphingomonas sp. CBMAI 2297]MDH4743055.1 TonB-dependent receptor [Sphingomonas sp. CBMAI 2297]
MRKGILRRNLWCAGALLAVMAGTGIVTPALAQEAQDTQAAPAAPGVQEQDQGTDGAIVVTGFRQSLQKALNLKRESVSSVDAVVAEDIAKFPDQNLAESLQRIPGISIQRDAGEGRAITVRGLSAQFTRVRLNGLETVATSTDGASANRDRAFDFNVFASELFTSLVVHKTAEASLDEGSLGAVVDLNTGNPLAGKAGFTFVGSIQGSYNDLSKNWGPRAAGLLSWKSPDGTLGASVSAAYSKTDNVELGNNSVRWAQAAFDSVNGTSCFATPNSGNGWLGNAACTKAALAFHPRIPRYGIVGHDRERLGVTGSVQWAPSDATKISIDGLYSRFKETREEKWLEVLARSNERAMDIVNPVYDANNNMISATINDAWVRTEHYLRKSDTEFYQLGGTWDQDLGDSFRFTLLGGFSRSNADIPVETTLILDDRDAQNYRYDYTDMKRPVLTFGTSVTDPANFQLAEIRDRPSNVTNKFRTAQLRTEWDVTEGFQIKSGAMYRRFDYEVKAFQRDTAVCGNGGLDLVLRTITCSPSSAFGPTAVYGFQATPALTELVNLGNAGQPAGTTTSWVVANIDAAARYTGLYNRALALDVGNNRSVIEEVKGGYLQFDAKGELLGLRYALNAGIRYASTSQTATGINGTTPVTLKRTYGDWLPAANLALFPTEKLILRAAIADVMTRPTLGSLTPGGSADGFNYRVNFGNPNLDPYRATSYDLAAEWYFAPQSIFSVALFKKDVKSFPVSRTLTEQTFLSTGLPANVLAASSPAFLDPARLAMPIWTVVTTINGTGASLKGAEIAIQAPFRFLPGFLKNFGGIANATFIDSTATYMQSAPGTAVSATGTIALPNLPFKSTLYGVSKRAFNATLYYEDKKFSARASVSYRGPYVDAGSGTGNVFEGYNAITNVDASVRYKLTDWIELSVEGTNLTDAYRDRYTDTAANRNYEYNHFGRTILFGARLKL